jgi:signal transduction histidine kinase
MTSRSSTIAARLTWMNMLVCTFALMIACVAFLIYDQFSVRQGMVSNLSTQAQIIGTNSVSALTFNDPQAAEATLAPLRSFPAVMSAGVLTPDGKIFAQYSHDQAGVVVTLPPLAPGQVETSEFSSSSVVLVRLIVFQGKQLGAVYVQRDLSILSQRLRRYLTIAIIVLILSLFAALFASRAMRRSVAEPIVQLADVATAISRRQDYTLRAAEQHDYEELERLTSSFNVMLEEISRRDAALQQSRAELEIKVDQRTRQLLASNRELEAFSYSVSHDLRGPLETISGFGHLLAKSGELTSKNQMYLDEIHRAVRRMAELIEDLLNLSRVSTTEMHKVKVNLSEMVLQTSVQMKTKEPGRMVHFIIGDSPTANGDPRLLQLVVENLLSNAWKYTSYRQQANIEFGSRVMDERVVYYVRDDGAGFDQRQADQLFKPFQRLHATAEFPGTGVGLATVQRIVQRHGGEIWAEAEVQKGATFYFTLESRRMSATG